MRRRTARAARLGAWLGAALLVTGCGDRLGPRTAVLTPDGGPELVVMDFARPPSLDPLSPGWHHRRFRTRPPMTMTLATKDGVPAVRLETRASASMLVRQVEVAVDRYPRLAWRWLVEVPVASAADESTRDGDDHPARLYLVFQTTRGQRRALEIVWGNRLRAGQYKFVGAFPHYVARGGDDQVGRWHAEEVDLAALTRRFWPPDAPLRLTHVALFCDSDETKGHTVAYFADVRLRRAS